MIRRILLPVFCLSLNAPQALAKSYLDHLKETNQILCKVMMSDACKGQLPKGSPSDEKTCLMNLNKMSEANSENKALAVNSGKSKACLDFLNSQKNKCMMELMSLSIQSLCQKENLM